MKLFKLITIAILSIAYSTQVVYASNYCTLAKRMIDQKYVKSVELMDFDQTFAVNAENGAYLLNLQDTKVIAHQFHMMMDYHMPNDNAEQICSFVYDNFDEIIPVIAFSRIKHSMKHIRTADDAVNMLKYGAYELLEFYYVYDKLLKPRGIHIFDRHNHQLSDKEVMDVVIKRARALSDPMILHRKDELYVVTIEPEVISSMTDDFQVASVRNQGPLAELNFMNLSKYRSKVDQKDMSTLMDNIRKGVTNAMQHPIDEKVFTKHFSQMNQSIETKARDFLIDLN